MAITNGNTNRNKTVISVTTSAGKVISSGNNYFPLSLLEGDDTYTLPDATENAGKQFIIDNDSEDIINVETVSLQTINGEERFTLNVNNAITLISHTGNWRIINSHII